MNRELQKANCLRGKTRNILSKDLLIFVSDKFFISNTECLKKIGFYIQSNPKQNYRFGFRLWHGRQFLQRGLYFRNRDLY